MDQLTAVVNGSLAGWLPRVHLRDLLAIARYHGFAVSNQAKETLVPWVLQTVYGPDLTRRLQPILTHSDRTLFAQLCAGDPSSLPPDTVRYAGQLYATRPPLIELRPLERLLALGLVLAIPGPAGPALVIPEEIVPVMAALRRVPEAQARVLAPLPPLAALLDDTTTLLATLATTPTAHTRHERLPGPLLRRIVAHCWLPELTTAAQNARLQRLHALLHRAGLLQLEDEVCVPALMVPAFLDEPPAIRLRAVLAAWVAQPLAPAELPAPLTAADLDGPALATWLWTRLLELPPGAVYLPDLLDIWTAPGGPPGLPSRIAPAGETGPAPTARGAALLARLLGGPLYEFGFVQIEDDWVALSTDGRIWLAGGDPFPVADTPPTLAGCAVRLPRLGAAPFRFALTPWAEPPAVAADGYTYRLTLDSVRQGYARYGSDRPLRALLREHCGSLPAPLRSLLAESRRPAALRLVPAWLLEAADPATLTDLLAQRALRRWVGPRLGPTAVKVRAEAPLRRALQRRGLLAPAPARPARPAASRRPATPELLLALRLAAQAAPDYAPLFTRQAGDLHARLTPAQRAEVDDLWARWEAPGEAEEPVPAGAEPCSTLDPPSVRRVLAAAITAGRPVHVRYYSAYRRAIGWRWISPLHLDPPYLYAFCLREQDQRQFRLDRILALQEA